MLKDALSSAIILVLGYGKEPYPCEDFSRLAEQYSSQEALEVEEAVRNVLNEMSHLKPDWSTQTLASAGYWAASKMKEKYPRLDSDALQALSWAFTWWWR